MKALCILAASLSLIASAQTFPVAGVIVDSETNAPMKRVHISLAPSDRRTEQVTMLTGEDGAFAFNARAGKYSLTAARNGIRLPFGLGPGASGFGSLIIAGPDQDTAHLLFRWVPPAAISGIVVDDRGEPAEQALVQLIRSSVAGGRKRLATAAWERTDDRGHYRFSPMIPGTYYLVVTGEPWYASRMTRNIARFRPPGSDQPAPDQPSAPTPAYAAIYYPNATDARGAAPLVLRSGAEAKADFTLPTVSGFNVHVNCGNATGRNGLLSLLADGIEGVEGFQRQLSFSGNSQTISGVPPGRYIVRIAGSGDNPFAVRKTIDVGTSDVTVDLTLQPPPSISGKVTFKNPGVKPRATLYVRLVNDANGATVVRTVGPDGGFSFPNVAVAKFRPVAASADGFFAYQVSAEGAALKNGILDVVDGATVRLDIVASDETGRLQGFVMSGDKPVPAMLVVLAPRAGTDPYNFRGFQTDTDGSFDFQNVHAGDYVLFANDRLDLEYTNPEAIRPYLASGKLVRIEPHAVSTESLTLSPAEPRQ
jgi:hypothetical protein